MLPTPSILTFDCTATNIMQMVNLSISDVLPALALKLDGDEQSGRGLRHYLSLFVDESGDICGQSGVCGCVVLSEAQMIVKNETFKETMI